jgi:hypothetical protein
MSIQAIAEIETDTLFIELVVDCSLYFEESDPSVGIMGSCHSPDGYELASVGVFNEDGESVWQSEDHNDMGLAVAFLTLAGHDCGTLIEDACKKEASNFDPRDYECFAP